MNIGNNLNGYDAAQGCNMSVEDWIKHENEYSASQGCNMLEEDWIKHDLLSKFLLAYCCEEFVKNNLGIILFSKINLNIQIKSQIFNKAM